MDFRVYQQSGEGGGEGGRHLGNKAVNTPKKKNLFLVGEKNRSSSYLVMG